MRRSALAVPIVLAGLAGVLRAQSPGPSLTDSDFASVCDAYGEAYVVVVGRAEPPVTFHVSGEAAIEAARQHLIATEAEVARLRESLDPIARLEREAEFSLTILDAEEEVARRRAAAAVPIEIGNATVQDELIFDVATK